MFAGRDAQGPGLLPCILHVSPESFVGGPLALAKNGDGITPTASLSSPRISPTR
jgi:dihydroxyacid dehydratase/phosphogluconate dehydratase